MRFGTIKLWSAAAAAMLTASACTDLMAQSRPVRLVVIGDSNVEGREVGAEANFTGQLQRALRQRGRNVSVINMGVRGDTIAGVLRRLDRDVPSGTDAAVVWIGVNDYRRGTGIADIFAGQKQIAARLAERRVPAYILTVPVYDVALHRNPTTRVSARDPHLNAAGYAATLQRAYPAIERLVDRSGRGSARR